jgi:hypothetical protein
MALSDVITQLTTKAQAADALAVQAAFNGLIGNLATDQARIFLAQPSGLFDAQAKALTIGQALTALQQTIVTLRAPTAAQALLDRISAQLGL